jgi:two-component system sensor histidine kinase AtoS
MIEKKHEINRRDHLAFIGEMSTRIAHEIKNPLASLQAGIQLLESNFPEDKKTAEYFHKLTSEVRRVDRIVKGLLSYSREEQLSRKKTDIVSLVEKVVALNKQGVKDKKINWKIESEDKNTVAKIDPLKIEQVFWNLLLNSTQAIKQEGLIKISIGNNSPDSIHCIIEDSGTGMTEEVQKKIFQPFFSTKSQGTGLGLAITKKIILAHDGEIKIISKPGEGTTVHITLPR